MNGLVGKSQMFIKRNSSTILTCIGAAGVVVTAVTAVKATPKALRLLEEAKKEKGEDLTKLETVKIAAPAYVPAALLGASTIACIFGANILNHRAQASLMSAYALVDSAYKDYRGKVDELYGEEAGDAVRAGIAKDKYEDQQIVPEGDNLLYFDFYSGRYFESTAAQVKNAEYQLNRKLMMDDCVYLSEWYYLLGIDPPDYGRTRGWSTPANSDMYWQTWIDFHHQQAIMDDGLECTIVTFVQDPYPDFEDYC